VVNSVSRMASLQTKGIRVGFLLPRR